MPRTHRQFALACSLRSKPFDQQRFGGSQLPLRCKRDGEEECIELASEWETFLCEAAHRTKCTSGGRASQRFVFGVR